MSRKAEKLNLRHYNRNEVVVFKKTKEEWGGLSNMASGYPIKINGIYIRNVEALYQACRFPYEPSIQKKILSQNSPMISKNVGKPYRELTRKDWYEVRISIMKWCLRVKLAQNYEKFSLLLLKTGGKPIVEESSKDDFWGAKPIDENTLLGVNALGRLLMQLRETIQNSTKQDLEVLPRLNISDFLILGDQIQMGYAVQNNSFDDLLYES